VFNADQVDGFGEATAGVAIAPSEGVDAFIARTGATIVHGGSRACYVPMLDEIHMPERASFIGSTTSTATETYYSTVLHELTHWTAPAHRCGRDLSGRFGDDAYAMEELVAELGAAFLCGELGITVEPRPDHAQYLAHWLTVLKADKRAIFTAASKAAEAAAFLRQVGSR
jgi:antirestriction protein ArdC